MTLIRKVLPAVILLGCLAVSAGAPGLRYLYRDEWIGIYQGHQKVGYAHISVRQDNLEGRRVYRRGYTVKRFVDGPAGQDLDELTVTIYADAGFNPVRMLVEQHSPALSRTTVVNYTSKAADVVVKENGRTTRRQIPIPEGRNLSTYNAYKFGARRVSEGDRFTVHYIEPTMLFLHRYTVNVLRSEVIDSMGAVRRAYVVIAEDDPESPTWQLPNGEFLRSEIAGSGEVWIRQGPNLARAGIEGSS
jgi:hypothetical protein